SCRYAVDHDVDEKARRWRGRASQYPGAAHFPDAVVKGGAAIAALSDVPAEGPLIEVGRAGNIGGGHLDVTDLAVRKRRHTLSFQRAPILASALPCSQVGVSGEDTPGRS